MKKERDPTKEEFQKLLLWLDEDETEAGRKLTVIQSRVTKILISRGCVDADDLTIEITNRITVRIDQVKQSYPDPLRCFLGFLQKVYREWLRDEVIKREARPPEPPRPAEVLEREDSCLKKCLAELSSEERDTFVRYFGGEGPARREERNKLAIEQDRTTNALRIQAHRLRKKTLKCLRACLEEAEAKR